MTSKLKPAAMNLLYNRIGKFLVSTFLVVALNISAKSQILATGDLVFTGYHASGPTTNTDQFAFVPLVNLPIGTVIKFTDNAWNSTTLTFNTTESNTTFTVTGAAITAGTEIIIVLGPPAIAKFTDGSPAGTIVVTGAISLPTAGDQIIAYQGADLAPTAAQFIAGIHMNVETGGCGITTAAGWDPASCVFPISPTNNTSMKPAAFTTGTNAFWHTVEHDNGKFNGCGLPLATAAQVRAAVNNPANWIFDDAGGAVAAWYPTTWSGCAFLGGPAAPVFTLQPPVTTTICEGAGTSFTIAATGASSYQWQVDNGGGFANLANNATYSGVTTVTLTITNAPVSLNGYLYRCVATNGGGSTNSNNATLNVTGLPVNPTLLAKIPATVSVADGTPVSATFNAGSGGSGGCTDDYRYTTNGGGSYTAYTPGTPISTTGLAALTGYVFIEGRRAGCASCSGSYVVLAAWYVTPLPAAATTLNAGDIAFSGYTSQVTDEFSFVLLKNIGPGTVINFTNNGWLSTNVFGVGEETVTWTSNAAYPAGTEIKIGGTTATLAAGGSAGTVTGVALNLATGGDQVLAYRGAPASPTFISGIHMNVEAGSTAAAWDGVVVSTSASALPTGLTTGVNCIWIGTAGDLASEFDNARYGTCAGPGTLGPINTLRAALNNQVNWIRDNSAPAGFTIPTGCLYFGLGSVPTFTLHPVASSVCEGISTSFTITASGAITYQWQVDNGGGFANLSNDATYSGVTTTTLNINATPFSLNGYLYRCVATNVSGSTNSNSALLTVTALPVSPTLLLKTPASGTVADGTPVSATFNAGSGGSGGCTDDFRYTIDGGTVYLPYTPGTNISTTGLAAGSGFVFIEGRRAGCATCSGSYSVLAAWRVTPLPAAPTTLNAGDIAFSGYASTAVTDEFSFVLLRNIGPGTVINFTDNGYQAGALTNVEQTVTWTAPAGGLPGGTEIKIAGLTATRSGPGAAGTVTGVALSLISTGDQVLAYRGLPATPTFISAIHMNVELVTTAAAWDGATVGTNASALPAGLTTGLNCIWIGTPGNLASEFSNSRYGNCSGPGILGPLTGLRAALNNQANWISDDNTPPLFTLPTGCNYLSVLCPTITVTNPVNTNGTVNVAFSETFTSTGGTPTVTYSTSSTLPTGLLLSSAGVLSGTPTQAGTFPIVVIATDGAGCTGTGATYNLVIACPAPITGTATPSSQTVCSGVAITTIVLSGAPAGAVYNWARDNNVAVTGIAASGSGDISGTLTNTTAAPVTVTFTITPTYYGTCLGTPYTATVLVNPAPDAVATPSSQTICSGSAITTIVLSGAVSGTVFNWTRDNNVAVTGIAASGAGDITGSLTNTTNAPVTVTFTITPTANSCPGTPITATVVVNPIPDASATPSSQNRCSGLPITPIVMSGAVSGTSFDWVRDNFPTIGGSIGASGSGNISGTLVNNTGSPVTVTFTITPTANSCPGTPITATVTVNPLPTASITGGNAYVCQESNPVLTAGFDPNYTYQWGRSLFTTPFTNLGTAQTQAITASGNYLLTVTNQYGCVDTAMTVMNVADYRFNGTLAAGDALQTGRINRFAVISTCAAPKACPGIFTATGNRLYDAYTITNVRNVPVCATIGINSFCATNIFCVAYLGSFNPASLCTNYLADPGSSFTQSGFYEATIPANGTIVVVVHEVNTSTGCGGYTLTVDVPRDPAAITVSPAAVSCSGAPITLTAPAANSYSWSPGGATTQSILHSAPGTTNYTVTLGYGNNGCTDSRSQSVTIVNPTVNPVANQYACNGSNVSVTFSGSDPLATYNWTNTNPAIGLAASGSGNLNFTATNATNAPISGTITVTPVNGVCSGPPITFTIYVASTPSITGVTNDDICEPGGVVNLAAAGNGAINWWDALTGGIVVNTGTTFNPNVTTTTTYYVDATTTSGPQTLLAMPAQSNTFPGNVRGYWFTAPTDFVITSLSVPTTASPGPQSIAVVKFNGNVPPPVFSATTNAFTLQFLTRNNAAAGSIPCNIPVLAGEVIGFLGYRGTINSYAPGDYNTSIAGFPVQLQRLGMQFPLTTTNPQNIWREFGAGTSISRIEFEYSAGQNCVSAPRVPVTATVFTLPAPTATPSTQTICSGTPITTIVLASQVPGTTFAWTRDNNVNVTGIAANGAGDISGTLTNNTFVPQTVTFTITATSPDGCVTAPITATVIVNPIPNAVATPAAQTSCSGSAITTIVLSGNVAGTVFNWTRNNVATVTGIAASGSGDISGALTNTILTPITVTFTITPTANGCPGAPITATVIVNPMPDAVATPSSQNACSGLPITPIIITGNMGSLAVYNWVRDNLVAATGIAASGTGDISGTLVNNTAAPVTVTFTITPTFTNGGVTCSGTPITATVILNGPPTISCPGNIALNNTIGQCGRVVAYSTTATGIPAPTITYTFTGATTASGSGNGSGSFFNAGVTNATVTATNICGTASCSFTVTITDAEPPSITCPAPVTVSCVSTVPAPNPGSVIATDNCPGVVVTHIGDVISAQTCANRYTITRTYRATDAANNFTECTQIITVNDQTAPTFTCPGPITVSCASAVPAPNIGTVTGVSDNCGGVVTVTHQGDVISAQTCANRYTITRTYRATDICGNFAECTQIITVNDIIPPSLTCPGPVTVSCASAVPAPNIGAVTGVSDNCAGVVTVTHQGDVISGQTCANRYTITRTYRATDICGNFADCTQIITVNDQTPPVLTCPGPITVSCASAVPAPNIALVTGVSDNCAGVVTVTHQGDAISAQTCVNRYTITRTYRATDVCGNFAECTQIITVNDQTAPVLTCPAPVTVSCTSAVPAPNTASVTGVSDNCGAVTVTHQGDVISAQTCTNRYTITRIYRATDACGNFAECTQIITVNDQTPPTITCPAPVTVSCASLVPTPDISSVTTSDNCGGVVTVTYLGDVISNQTCVNRYTITRTYRATDACGNFADCTQIITVNDQTPPTFTCPGPVTVSCASQVPAPNVALVSGVSDNCGGPVTISFVSDVISAQTCANRYTITRTYRATDACGNFADCTQIITVNDQTPPTLTCPGPITVCGPAAVPAANIALVTGVSDNCGGAVTVTFQGDVNNCPACVNVPYTITRTYRATDACGNFAECTQTITVNPIPNAVATPATQTICSGSAITTIVLSGNVAGTVYNWTRDNVTTVAGLPGSGSGNISGTLTSNVTTQVTITFTITPIANGCPGTPITATVIVNPKPTITCPANIVVNAVTGTCSADVVYPPATATGTPAPTVTYSIPSGSFFNVGVTTVTATASNICGTVTCTFTITVLDVRVPVVTTQPVNSSVCVGGSATFSVVATNASSYQWQTGNANNQWGNIPGATSATYTVNNAPLSLNNAIYRVAITGPCGTVVFSNPVTLTVNPLPLITLSSASTPELVPGRTVTINATAIPPGGTYAWLFNGNPITGATGTSLGPLDIDNIGRYNVIYTDLNGCVNTSSDFLVTGEYSITFWVYPNPTSNGQFQVRFNNHNGEVAKVRVFDPLGQLVFQEKVTTGPTTYSRIDVNLANAANGVYIVELLNGSDLRVGAQKLLIAR
jgi:hypothetical protein